jgi:hypothetical protein
MMIFRKAWHGTARHANANTSHPVPCLVNLTLTLTSQLESVSVHRADVKKTSNGIANSANASASQSPVRTIFSTLIRIHAAAGADLTNVLTPQFTTSTRRLASALAWRTCPMNVLTMSSGAQRTASVNACPGSAQKVITGTIFSALASVFRRSVQTQ